MRIELKDITDQNRQECFELKVSPAQSEYIASNEISLQDAKENAEVARPFAIYADGKMVGFTMFAWDENNEDPEDKYWLWRFMIDESLQGNGYGRLALGEIIKYFRDHGADIITLSTKESNTRALSLYHQYGFKENGDMNDDEIVLKLYLSPNVLTHIGTQTIETERMILRRFEYSDNEAMRKNWISDEKIQSMYAEPVYTTEDEVRKLLDKYINSYEKEDYYRWAIIDKESGECIGQIAYFLVDSKNHFAEIEYCIGSAFQRRGLATEAAKAVIVYGFERIHLHKVQICTKTINAASRKVIEKCGLTYEGTLRDYFYDNGQYVGRLFFSILREEYEAR